MNAYRFWYSNETANVPALWHYGGGIFSLICLILGVTSNGLVIFVFIKNNVLQKPKNYFLINLAVTDFGLLLTNNSMHLISSFKKKWIFGQIGCNFYSVCGGIFGLTSISTMAAISLTRLIVVNKPFSSLKVNSQSTLIYIGCAWIYGSIWIIPPLFGWNRFILEGFETSCTFDYVSKDLWDRIFVFLLLTGGFVIPFSIIIFSYIFILIKLSERGRQTPSSPKTDQYSTQQGTNYYFNQLTIPNKSHGRQEFVAPLSFTDENVIRNAHRTEQRVARTALLICMVFCSAWGPYAFMTLFSLFGFDHLINAYTTSILGMFTKLAACINPLIYALSLNTFRERICSYVLCIYHCDTKYQHRLVLPDLQLARTSYSSHVNNRITSKFRQAKLIYRLDSSKREVV